MTNRILHTIRNNRYQLLIVFFFLIITVLLTRMLFVDKTVRVGLDQVAVRTGPALSYKKVGSLSEDTRVTVLKNKNGWIRVRYHDHHFGWIPKWLTNRTFPAQKATNLSEATIVLDPGHGGNDSGALGINQKHEEKTYTLKTAQAVKKALENRGARVFMTRSSDVYVGLAPRPALANKHEADAFISFHYDSAPTNNSGSGDTTYYYHKDTSLRLAQIINAQLKEKIALDNRGVQFGDFEVIRDNYRPALLIEGGYINTNKDFRQISSHHYRKQVSQAIATGLNQFFSNN